MSIDWGALPANTVIPFIFTSHDAATGANETMSGLALADIQVYKGVSLTQRSSTAGFAFFGGDADGLDLDTFVGVNGVSIDTGDDTDAGFYAVGSLFTVVLGPVTIDAQTVYTVLGTFRLVAAEAIAGKPKADVDGWLGTAAATPTVAGVPEVDVTHVAGSTTSVSTLASSVATLLADIGGVATAAADGDPTSTDLLFAYIKQLINILVGSAGVVTFPAAAAPANAVSLAEIIRAIYDDTNALPDSGALTTVQSDLDNIQTRLPAALVGGRMDSDVAAIQAAVITAAAIAPDAIGASELAADAVAEIADAVWDELLTGHTTLATFGQVMNAHGARTGEINDAGATTTVFIVDGFTEATDNHFIGDIIVFTSGALIGQARRITAYTGGTQTITVSPALTDAPANNDDFVIIPFARVDLGHINNVAQTATLDDIEAQTDDIGAAGAGLTAIPWNAAWDAEVESEVDDALGAGTGTALTAIPWNAAWDAEVQSEVDDALVAQRLDELLNADSDIDGVAPPAVGSVVHELLTKSAAGFTYDQATDSLEAVRDQGDSAWATAVGFATHTAADVWAAATRLLTAGTNIVLAKGVGVTGFNDLSAAQVNAEVDTALADYDAPTSAELVTEIDAVQTDIAALWTTALTEAYAADGVAPTPAQLLFMLWSLLGEKAIVGTTLTARRLDGTTAMTFTLDSATAPTSITRAT